MFDFTDRVVIVTGAAGNLGGAVARSFSAAGSRLVLVDHKRDRLPQLFAELTDSSRHFLANSVDLTDEEAVEWMVEQTMERFGRIDVLVNAAGGFQGGSVQDTSLETWQHVLDLNARTVFVASRAVIPVMQQQGAGRIINVASRSGLQGSARSAAYSAAKSAVIRLTESMSADLKKGGINVNCVLPSTIDTPENRASMPKADASRWVEPGAIADVILFLASDAARAIHGAAIPVYGLA